MFSEDSFYRKLGLDPSYNIDPALLERNFLKLSKKTHPDFAQGKTPAELAVATKKSAVLNEAYNTLKNPLLRAKYLVANLFDGDMLSIKEGPEGFSQKIFLLQEEVEENEGDQDYLQALKKQIEADTAGFKSRISSLFEEIDIVNPDQNTCVEIIKCINAINFMRTLMQNINNKD